MGMTTSFISINPHIVSRASETICCLHTASNRPLGIVAAPWTGAFDIDRSVTWLWSVYVQRKAIVVNVLFSKQCYLVKKHLTLGIPMAMALAVHHNLFLLREWISTDNVHISISFLFFREAPSWHPITLYNVLQMAEFSWASLEVIVISTVSVSWG